MPARRSWWARLTPANRTLLILGAVAALPLLFCVGGLALVALSDDSRDAAAPAPATSHATAASASPSPVVVKRTVTETEEIPFEKVEVEDSALPEGTREVRTEGAAGERTITYEVTITDGVETGKRRVEAEITREPVDRVVAIGTKPPAPAPAPEPDPEDRSGCHSSYDGPCVPTGVADVDCAGGSGDGPAYVRGPVYIVGPDEYDLDRDGDGVACENG